MDRMIYTAMTGLKHTLEQQATNSHNLANVNSTGFRAQIDNFRAVPIQGQGLPTRAFVVDAEVGSDFTPGAIQGTGRDLDAALPDEGWFAVQRADGTEAYTRNGAFKLNENGVLQTSTGLSVLGDGGPISIPPDVSITIGRDGTISSASTNTLPGPSTIVGRLKLVNPPLTTMVRGEDGLFSPSDGSTPAIDPSVVVVSGALESSNVNIVDSMVNMINLARQFDMQMKLLKDAENNAGKASQLLSLSA